MKYNRNCSWLIFHIVRRIYFLGRDRKGRTSGIGWKSYPTTNAADYSKQFLRVCYNCHYEEFLHIWPTLWQQLLLLGTNFEIDLILSTHGQSCLHLWPWYHLVVVTREWIILTAETCQSFVRYIFLILTRWKQNIFHFLDDIAVEWWSRIEEKRQLLNDWY